ncbi:hypothetical protein [Bacillus sp. B-jedd]|uniref:hypothetical protein n=1 Tax=Bacillus sp. B-jedd TaxID=1476857 RepID=UPI0005156FFB|nr:hypothetical protein [Bacillus sp. B-jedd]CEG02213.1 hypothetical protein BN1002_04790 [Bacillus sp. B-jedd]CEG25987.1 hypothetical protein BN1002_00825 [Bacillus sp. B-jedd]CEG29583.1 hypothetical protein BN1002_04541 [Bacillus sp. B-jedd]
MQLTLFEESRDYREHIKYRKGIFKTKTEIIKDLYAEGKERIYHVLSFGGGTQSSHLLEQHFRGEIHYDFIVFSDTGAEPDFIHSQVAWWQHRQKENGNTTPFIITGHSSMEGGLEEMLMRYIHTEYQRFQMPVYCNKIDEETGQEVAAGIMPRQCTVDFKIVPVKQTVRRAVLKQVGLTNKQKMPADIAFIIDIGFSFDEIRRINLYKSPQFKYMYLAYPLVEEGLTTQDSIQYLIENGFPTKRSRCYFCPFNCDNRDIGMDWNEIIEDEPLSFLKACYFDSQLRAIQKTGKKNMRSIPYLHEKRIPLEDVYPDEYSTLSSAYESEFLVWRSKWEKRIKDKYILTA